MSNLRPAVRAFASEAAEPQALCSPGKPDPVRQHRQGRFISFSLVLDAAAVLPTTPTRATICRCSRRSAVSASTSGPVLGVIPARRSAVAVALAPAIG